MGLKLNKVCAALQRFLDVKVVAGAKSGHMFANASKVNVVGAGTIQIPTIELGGGITDYDRNEGYGTGDVVTFDWTEVPIDVDKKQSFILDAESVKETNFIASAQEVSLAFVENELTPWLDCYNFSHTYQALDAVGSVRYSEDFSAMSGKELLERLVVDITNMRDEYGIQEVIVYISSALTGKLATYTLEKYEFKNEKGEVTTTCKHIDGAPLLPVPSSRMKTHYDYTVGAVPMSGAGDINYMIVPVNAAMCVCKTNKTRILSPEINTTHDAWKIDTRFLIKYLMLSNVAKVSVGSVKGAKPVESAMAKTPAKAQQPQVQAGMQVLGQK